MTHGLTIIYYGNGKGKTTAALGAAFRSLGQGMNVKVLQFIKADSRKIKKKGAIAWTSGEVLAAEQWPRLKNFAELSIEALGTGFVGILGDSLPKSYHRQKAKKTLAKAEKIIKSKKWQVVILDEILRAIGENLLSENDVLRLIRLKPKDKHLILTGHRITPKILARADLVTEMKKIRHPYDAGILAQKGIDF